MLSYRPSSLLALSRHDRTSMRLAVTTCDAYGHASIVTEPSSGRLTSALRLLPCSSSWSLYRLLGYARSSFVGICCDLTPTRSGHSDACFLRRSRTMALTTTHHVCMHSRHAVALILSPSLPLGRRRCDVDVLDRHHLNRASDR